MKSQTIKVGDTVVFEGKVIGKPDPEIHWCDVLASKRQVKPQCRFRDTIEITAEDCNRYKFESKPDGVQRLTIASIQNDDVGEYRCEAANPHGVTWSDATLTVVKGALLSLRF